MTDEKAFARLSQIQEEILGFTWGQVGEKVDKFFVQGKISDDDLGRTVLTKGNMIFAAVGGAIVNNSEVLSDEQFAQNSDFILPRIKELHDLLIEAQGKSPVRFRWAVNTATGQVESDWTYYDDLTCEEQKGGFWELLESDFAWKVKLEADLVGE